ncbi:serine/threonine-protein kinase [Amycolatopsis suaedae]|uniref:Serine/threonine protein kinase n=1 Tax=Amycolatopsis suaedae TaxID=2510978 RepID=A0A4Q7J379_9PSEU|nr:serine/threonine-protein kinase [Amycolatopsis suaedae]RZQ61930.1 serine/threonine protein kinase [Amycolatopsis suaedae]
MKPLAPGEPRQVGPYRLIAALGEGGMGRVVLGLSPDGRLAAVKQVHAEFAADDGFRSRFRHEVDASRRVSGAYTAAVLDADPEAATPWLASVFVAGPSLREAVDAAGPLPVPTIRHLAAGLAAALADIHRAGLIHRDLKPGNVILTEDGARVIDFGIARATEGVSELTGTGAVIGSPAFMSPEQAESRPITPASDVFSLGTMLVMAATGGSPFLGESTPQTLYNLVHTEPDLRAVPAELLPLIGPCLAKDPAHRPTPVQILDFLGHTATGPVPWPHPVRELIAGQQAQVRAALAWPVPPPPPPPARRGRGLVAVAAVALVVAATVTTVVLADRDDEPPAPPPPSISAADALHPDRLRATDPCRALSEQPDPRLGKLQPSTGNVSHLSACEYETDRYDRVRVRLGMDMIVAKGTPAEPLEGLPVLRVDKRPGCDAVIQLPTMPTLGLMVGTDSTEAGACDVARTLLTEVLARLRSGQAVREPQASALAGTDPCRALSQDAVASVAGPVTKVEPTALDSCAWTTAGHLTLSFVRSDDLATDEKYEPFDIGWPAYRQKSDSGSPVCAVSWAPRPSVVRTENVRISFNEDGMSLDEACEKVKSIAQRLELPR